MCPLREQSPIQKCSHPVLGIGRHAFILEHLMSLSFAQRQSAGFD
jgi:hypothetical protein